MGQVANDASTILKLLYELQLLEFDIKKPSPEQEAKIRYLRETIPVPYLRHFDRLKALGRKAVSVVKNGVCSECCMALSSGILNQVKRGDDIYICESCARYLYYPLK